MRESADRSKSGQACAQGHTRFCRKASCCPCLEREYAHPHRTKVGKADPGTRAIAPPKRGPARSASLGRHDAKRSRSSAPNRRSPIAGTGEVLGGRRQGRNAPAASPWKPSALGRRSKRILGRKSGRSRSHAKSAAFIIARMISVHDASAYRPTSRNNDGRSRFGGVGSCFLGAVGAPRARFMACCRCRRQTRA